MGSFWWHNDPIDTTFNKESPWPSELLREWPERKLRSVRLSLVPESLGLRVMVVWGTPLILASDRFSDRLFDLLRLRICSYCYYKLVRLSISYLLEPR